MPYYKETVYTVPVGDGTYLEFAVNQEFSALTITSKWSDGSDAGSLVADLDHTDLLIDVLTDISENQKNNKLGEQQ